MRSKRWTRLLAGIFGVALILSACGGDDDGENGEPTGATGATTGATGATGEDGAGRGDEIIIQGFAFQPGTLEISGPTEVTITNEDAAPHTFTLDDESIDVSLDGGASATVTLDLSESTGYFCRIHPNMTGVIEVV
jgi:plastocyanin